MAWPSAASSATRPSRPHSPLYGANSLRRAAFHTRRTCARAHPLPALSSCSPQAFSARYQVISDLSQNSVKDDNSDKVRRHACLCPPGRLALEGRVSPTSSSNTSPARRGGWTTWSGSCLTSALKATSSFKTGCGATPTLCRWRLARTGGKTRPSVRRCSRAVERECRAHSTF